MTYRKFAVFELKQVSGRKFLDIPKRSRRVGNISELRVLSESLAIDLRKFWRNGEDGFDFGTKQQPLAVECIMERLLSQAVARDQHLAATFVVKREREHSPQLVDAIPPHLLVQMNNHFRIAVGRKMVATRQKLGTKLRKVINFAVENHPYRTVLVKYRLVSSSQIDDAQAAHSQAGSVFDENALVIRDRGARSPGTCGESPPPQCADLQPC